MVVTGASHIDDRSRAWLRKNGIRVPGSSESYSFRRGMGAPRPHCEAYMGDLRGGGAMHHYHPRDHGRLYEKAVEELEGHRMDSSAIALGDERNRLPIGHPSKCLPCGPMCGTRQVLTHLVRATNPRLPATETRRPTQPTEMPLFPPKHKSPAALP